MNNKRAIWIGNINNEYNPEILALTLPLFKQYAFKTKADLNILTERKFPEWHITYEKAQVYLAGKDYYWNMVMDTDILIHPDCPDLFERVPDFIVGLKESYSADGSFLANQYFYRDQRKVGINACFAMASAACHDFWTPLEWPEEYCISQIHMRPEERERGVDPRHFITEYWMSNNLAKYGLKYDGILHNDEIKRNLIFHTYFAPLESQKLIELRELYNSWNL